MNIPESLKEAIAKDRVIIFVGAGLSMAAGLPSWMQLVERVLNESSNSIEKSQGYLTALKDEILTPLEVLDRLQSKHRKEIYSGFERSIGKPFESNIHEAVSRISKRIITTNYDKLLEFNTKIDVIDKESTFSLQKLDHSNEFILKIHGDISSLDKAVIFTTDYDELYQRKGLAEFQIKKLFSQYSCIFIGFSLSDHYVTNLFEYLDDIYDQLGVEHYAISTKKIEYDFVKTIEIDSFDRLHEAIELLAQPHSSKKKEIKNETGVIFDEDSSFYEVTLSSGSDTPPVVDYWAGREKELNALIQPFKVSFITGIGGQGKSSLASKFLSKIDRNEFKYVDWRDFKEEDLNLQEKLYKMIESVSCGMREFNSLIGLDTEQLIDVFFDALADQKGVFVLDNVDRYVDLTSFTLNDGMGIFLNAALTRHHQSRFLFTCRPFIHLAEPGFYQIKLEGLDYPSVLQITKQIVVNTPQNTLESIAKRIHTQTSGHPLWVSIILGQHRNGLSSINNLLDKIQDKRSIDLSISDSSIMSTTILKEVWSNLKEKEKTLLRALSIAVSAENKDDLAKIVSSKINYNQFNKSLKSLKFLNLIIEKEEDGFIELHPLVREFIKSNYAASEQQTYVSLFVKYYDQFILIIKSKIGKVLDADEIEKIRNKIEILIDANDIQSAINDLTIHEASFQLSGFSEDHVRLCERIFKKIEWKTSSIEKIKKFNIFFFDAMTAMTEYGALESVDFYTNKYESIIKTVDEKKILLLSSRTYRRWISLEHDEAIRLGRAAVSLVEHLGETEKWQAKNRLSLALRDSKSKENIEEALRHFFSGINFPDISLDTSNEDDSWSANFGNIGRCFSLLKNNAAAYYYITKSYIVLNSNTTAINKQNLGFAAEWLGDIIATTGSSNDSAYFYAHAKNIWKNTMPAKSNEMMRRIISTATPSIIQTINDCEAWQIEKFCNDWVYLKSQELRSQFTVPPGFEFSH